MKRFGAILLAVILVTTSLACASSSGSTRYRSGSIYRGGSVHYNSFPDAYDYGGRMGMPY